MGASAAVLAMSAVMLARDGERLSLWVRVPLIVMLLGVAGLCLASLGLFTRRVR